MAADHGRHAHFVRAQISLSKQGVTWKPERPGFCQLWCQLQSRHWLGPQKTVCGFVNGKKFVGMFAKPEGDATEFLPIKVTVSEEEQDAVKQYCRIDGIYLPQ